MVAASDGSGRVTCERFISWMFGCLAGLVGQDDQSQVDGLLLFCDQYLLVSLVLMIFHSAALGFGHCIRMIQQLYCDMWDARETDPGILACWFNLS